MQTCREYKEKMNDVLNYLHAAEDAIGNLKDIEDSTARVAFREALTWTLAAIAHAERANRMLDTIEE